MENDLISRAELLDKIDQWANKVKGGTHPTDRIVRDVLEGVTDTICDEEAIEAYKPGWEVFDDLSSAYYGKQMYFTQPDGTIYSRLSCGYMTFEEALAEFRVAIAKEDDHG